MGHATLNNDCPWRYWGRAPGWASQALSRCADSGRKMADGGEGRARQFPARRPGGIAVIAAAQNELGQRVRRTIASWYRPSCAVSRRCRRETARSKCWRPPKSLRGASRTDPLEERTLDTFAASSVRWPPISPHSARAGRGSSAADIVPQWSDFFARVIVPRTLREQRALSRLSLGNFDSRHLRRLIRTHGLMQHAHAHTLR